MKHSLPRSDTNFNLNNSVTVSPQFVAFLTSGDFMKGIQYRSKCEPDNDHHQIGLL